jgi:RNA-splicing ligase RtcB
VPHLHAQLADRLEERQRLDVAHRAADLDHADVGFAGAHAYALLDLVGDVRNHLHRGAKVVAAAFLGDHALVDAAGREIAVAPGRRAHVALVVTKIQVGLGAVVGDEHLAVLERAHRARVDVDVGVELDHRDLEAARFENGT